MLDLVERLKKPRMRVTEEAAKEIISLRSALREQLKYMLVVWRQCDVFARVIGDLPLDYEESKEKQRRRCRMLRPYVIHARRLRGERRRNDG